MSGFGSSLYDIEYEPACEWVRSWFEDERAAIGCTCNRLFIIARSNIQGNTVGNKANVQRKTGKGKYKNSGRESCRNLEGTVVGKNRDHIVETAGASLVVAHSLGRRPFFLSSSHSSHSVPPHSVPLSLARPSTYKHPGFTHEVDVEGAATAITRKPERVGNSVGITSA